MSASRATWIETEFRDDPISAIKQIMSSHATGQMILNVSQGTVGSVVWREKSATVSKNQIEGITAKS